MASTIGRPAAYNDIVAHKILKALEAGLPRNTAAKLAGISPTTLYNYLRRGRAGEEPYTQFVAKARVAEASAEAELVAFIREAAKNRQWQAAAWILERRMPEKYALRKPEPREQEVSKVDALKLLAEAADLHTKLKAVGE